MSTVIENLINGNLSDAKKGAKRMSHKALRDAAMDYGHNDVSAAAVADYLKGSITFQQKCDITHREQDAGRIPKGI